MRASQMPEWAMLLVTVAAELPSIPLKEFGGQSSCLSESCPNTALLSQPGSQAPWRDSRNVLGDLALFPRCRFSRTRPSSWRHKFCKHHTPPTLLQSSAMSFAPFFFQITYNFRQTLHLGDRSTLGVPIEDSLKMEFKTN